MTDKERIMQKYEEWGLGTCTINAQVAIDCYSAIQGLEEAIHNLQAIVFIPSTEIDTAKRALMKELAVISANAATMLNRYLPEISQEEADEPMTDKLQEYLPSACEIMNALKAEIDIIHSACDESGAVSFRQDLATLIGEWAIRVNGEKEADPAADSNNDTPF